MEQSLNDLSGERESKRVSCSAEVSHLLLIRYVFELPIAALDSVIKMSPHIRAIVEQVDKTIVRTVGDEALYSAHKGAVSVSERR